MVGRMLEASIIQPSQNAFSLLVVMVYKKEGSWCMCLDYRELNKIAIEDKFPILVIDELLDELHGVVYFTKLNLYSGYHHIRMKKLYQNKHAKLMKVVMNFWSCLLELQMNLPNSKV